QRTLICPPRCRLGALTAAERTAVQGRSPLAGKYDQTINRESAYEILSRNLAAKSPAGPPPAPLRPSSHPAGAGAQDRGVLGELLWGNGRRQGVAETLAKQTARTIGSQLGRQIVRGLLGGIFGGGRR
ncbi:MAG: DUF853 family protein, partial [Desulfuromonas thiophila]|nr:DUF853 family protein [Desulfuromonas thiophila]